MKYSLPSPIVMLVLLSLGALLSGCLGSEGSSQDDSLGGPESPESPVIASADHSGDEISIELEHSADSNAERFNLYYAQEPITDVANYGVHDGSELIKDAESSTTVTVETRKPVYHFRATAVADGNESEPSEESVVIPRYEIVSNGERVRDHVTGYEWIRCLEGQSWSQKEQDCIGEAQRFSLGEGKDAARAKGMRVPKAHELLTIVYCENNNPAYFPHDPDPNKEIGGEHETSGCKELGEKPAVLERVFPNVNTDARHLTDTICSKRDGNIFMTFVHFNSYRGSGVRGGCTNPPSLLSEYLRPVKEF